MWSTSAGGHLMKVVNLTGFTVFGNTTKFSHVGDLASGIRVLLTTTTTTTIHNHNYHFYHQHHYHHHSTTAITTMTITVIATITVSS